MINKYLINKLYISATEGLIEFLLHVIFQVQMWNRSMSARAA